MYSSVINELPRNDLKPWYEGIQQTREKALWASSIKQSARLDSTLEQQVLKDINNTLTQETPGGGLMIILPDDVYRFPYNLGFAIWGTLPMWALIVWVLYWCLQAIKRLHQKHN